MGPIKFAIFFIMEVSKMCMLVVCGKLKLKAFVLLFNDIKFVIILDLLF